MDGESSSPTPPKNPVVLRAIITDMSCSAEVTMAPLGGETMSSPATTSEAIVLRQASMADAEALALVGAATFLEAFTWMLPGADIVAHCRKHHTADAYRSYLRNPETRITLAEVVAGAAPVGYAMLTTPELPTFAVRSSDLELKRIYLFSRFRSAATPVLHRGHDGRLERVEGLKPAQALLDAALEGARTLGKTRLLLGTHAGNQRAITFYRRNGFSEAGTRTFQVGAQLCCDLIFARDL